MQMRPRRRRRIYHISMRMGSQENRSSFHLGCGKRTPLALCLDQMVHNEDLQGIQNLVVKAFDVTKKDWHHEAHHLAMNQWRLAVTDAAIKSYYLFYIRGILTGG